MSLKRICFALAIACLFTMLPNGLFSIEVAYKKLSSTIPYKQIEIARLTRYTEDRIAFQHIQLPGVISGDEDNSVSSLLIIRNSQVYLLRDGYDDVEKVRFENYWQDVKGEVPKDLWVNKINSKPDYVKIADRRSEILYNVSEDFVDKNFGDNYRNIRNAFLHTHVKIFKRLMRERTESEFYLQIKMISPPAFQEQGDYTRFATVVKAKTMNGTLYFAEDMDGDDVTETFCVSLKDGFNWGFKSGPNIIFIFNNTEEDIKQLIGSLCHEAYFGTTEEEKNILETFPKVEDILDAFRLEKVEP